MKLSIKGLFLKYKMPISLTFLLLSLEAILLVLIPYALGLGIDSLSQDRFDGIYVLGVILFLLLLISTGRRLYDTRVYSKIYALLGVCLIKAHKKDQQEDSVIVTRSTLIKELVDFFEHDLTKAYTSLIGIVGALGMIIYLQLYVFLFCVVLMALIYWVYSLSQEKIFSYNAELNHELEKRLTMINRKNIFLVGHFKRIASSMIKLSDIESYNYVLIQLLIGLLLMGSLFIGMNAELSTGDIFALLTYVLNFSFEVLTLPVIFQQFIRLQEITSRISKGS